MSDGTTGAPAAGWYTDPGATTAYRWWDGTRWTTATLPDRPTQGAGSTPAAQPTPAAAQPAQQPPAASTIAASATVPATPAGALPTRRSVRAQSAATSGTQPAVTPEATMPHTAAPPVLTPAVDSKPATGPSSASAAAPTQQPERQVSPPVGAQPAPAVYRPVNPLEALRASEVPVSPPGFTVPAAWAANAPVAPPTPGYAVYPGQPGQPLYGAVGMHGGTLPEPKNTPARLALTFALLVVMLSVVSGLITESGAGGAAAAVTFAQFGRLALVGLILATIPLAIVGLVRASSYKKNGFRAKGRPQAVVALILVALWIFLIVAAAAVALHNPALRTQQTSTPAGTSQQAGAPAVEPDVAVLQGDGTYAYSQAQAQAALGAAYTQALKSTPTSVVCPATEPMQVSISFACTVTIQGGTVTTAQVTIVDPQGHVEVQVH